MRCNSPSTCSTSSTARLDDGGRAETPCKGPEVPLGNLPQALDQARLRSSVSCSSPSSLCSASSTTRLEDVSRTDILCKAPEVSPCNQVLARRSARFPTRLNPLGIWLSIDVAALTEVDLSVELKEGEATGGSLASGHAEFRSRIAIAGSICVAGVPVVPFGIQTELQKNGELGNYVIAQPRLRGRVTHALGELVATGGMSTEGRGVLLEVEVSSGSSAELHIKVRPAKKKELAALQQEQQLLKSMEKGKYMSIIAQIVRAKHRSVNLSVIGEAEKLLKSMDMPEDKYLNHAEIKKLMKWKLVTNDIVPRCEPCPNEACPCNAGFGEHGEICTMKAGMVQEALGEIWPAAADKMLFKAIVRAALGASEGCVWKSGGKFILSNKEQNQSTGAILNSLSQSDAMAAKAMRSLIAFTDALYGVKVNAVQINIHPNETSSHNQHRDIYGAGQKGGPNCTCSFVPAVGSVCYSVGSCRHVLTQTLSDTRSKYEACGDSCTGMKNYLVASSGSAMFMNGKFNNNHSHGVPKMEGKCGPRISLAFLLTKGTVGTVANDSEEAA